MTEWIYPILYSLDYFRNEMQMYDILISAVFANFELNAIQLFLEM